MPKHKGREAAVLLAVQRWAYERHVDHLTLQQISDLSAMPPSDGGIGKALSRAVVRELIGEYREGAVELETIKRDEHIARELADLDRVQAMLAPMTERLDVAATVRLAAQITGKVLTIEQVRLEAPEAMVYRSDVTVMQALRDYRVAGESRRKLLGLDAPTESHVNVVSRDAVTEELNAMLTRNGRKPITAAP